MNNLFTGQKRHILVSLLHYCDTLQYSKLQYITIRHYKSEGSYIRWNEPYVTAAIT